MYRSILVPLDGSAFGEHAVPLALSLARRSGATVHVVHVHVPPIPLHVEGVPIHDPQAEEAVRNHERTYLSHVENRLRAAAQVPFTATLLEGAVHNAVQDKAQEVNADLVVLTTHGRGPLSRFWLGSVADQLIRHLPMPIILVRPEQSAPNFSQEVNLRRILVTLDGTTFAEEVLPTATGLSRLTHAELSLLRVTMPLLPGDYHLGELPMSELSSSRLTQLRAMHEDLQEQAARYLDSVAARLCEQGLSVQTQVRCHAKPATAILEEAAQQHVDLIALQTHARRGLARLFLGSVADKVIRGATTAVLIHRPSNS